MEKNNYILPEIPQMWVWTQLDILGKGNNAIVDGPFGSNLKTSDYINDSVNGVPVLTTKNLEGDYSEKSVRFISQKKYEELKRSQVNGGDILVAKIGSIGKTGIYPKNAKTAIIPANLLKFTVTDRVNFKFVYNYLNYSGFQKLIKSIARATAQPAFNVTKFRTLKIPLPSFPEQQRIVAKIEELFSEFDNGIENLKKARKQLKTYRQAVLKYAFKGKLTKEWLTLQGRAGKPQEPAEKLLEQIKIEREKHYQKQLEGWKRACEQAKTKGNKKPARPRKPKELSPLTEKELADFSELPEGWGWIKSGNLFSFVTSGSRGWAKYYSSNGSIFIRIANLDFDSLKIDLNRNNIQFVKPPIGSEGTRTKTEKGDFLFSITGYLGMFAIVPDLRDAYINQHVALARPFNGFNKEYVGYYCIAKTGGYFHLNKNQKGATKAGLTLEDIRTFPIPVCPVLEQYQIVSEIESRLSVCDKIEQTIEDSLKKAEALRQSILKKAFAGELTRDWREKHPELVTGENSAEKLLEKIKSAKALSEIGRKKPRSKKTKKK
jgi:type I restriction enzyme S subunit